MELIEGTLLTCKKDLFKSLYGNYAFIKGKEYCISEALNENGVEFISVEDEMGNTVQMTKKYKFSHYWIQEFFNI